MELLKIAGSLILSLIISLLTIPSIVRVAKSKRLCEKPHDRHIHHGSVPTLGGCAIFGAFLTTLFIFAGNSASFIPYFAAACIILFFTGIKDDILIIAPLTKLAGQIAAALVLCGAGDIRITSMQGLFNIQELPYVPSLIVSIVLVVAIINAFNLIDGIDGLAGLLSVVSTLLFSVWFWGEGNEAVCIASASFVGAVIGFLRYNLFSKSNKIFMGDTGAQIVGLFCVFLAIMFIEGNNTVSAKDIIIGSPAVAFAIMAVPTFDVLRVMFLRIVLKRPIFQPDNIHIHYKLLELGLSHIKADLILAVFNILFAIAVYIAAKYIYINRLGLIMILVLMVAFHIPQLIINHRRKKLKQ
ncbi:MAG: undecaprenyl/decaprenyl-phosphate alpha-N-acetylglucosaminyl 1-phosphate transferase [Bacteroidales bacterium]|nr:undecaprenyl/decaprenyl-phosphate alpha-N-acetylglucosaminyl 1-phosphate transferase [Bacteroidales bacterium]